MSQKENIYELMVILKPLLPDDVRKAIHKSISDLTEELEGTVKDADVWGKRYLAYEIDKHNEGYYILYQLNMPSSNINEFKRKLAQKKELLRLQIIRIDDAAELGNSIKKKEISLDDEE